VRRRIADDRGAQGRWADVRELRTRLRRLFRRVAVAINLFQD
jgi:hypothetical protein